MTLSCWGSSCHISGDHSIFVFRVKQSVLPWTAWAWRWRCCNSLKCQEPFRCWFISAGCQAYRGRDREPQNLSWRIVHSSQGGECTLVTGFYNISWKAKWSKLCMFVILNIFYGLSFAFNVKYVLILYTSWVNIHWFFNRWDCSKGVPVHFSSRNFHLFIYYVFCE